MNDDGLSLIKPMEASNPMVNRANNPGGRQVSDTKLPWWVEFLFVQIGLPDLWLRAFLKTKKKTRKFINDNKKPIGCSLIALTAAIYIQPLIRQSSNFNNCISTSKTYLVQKSELRNQPDDSEIIIWAHQLCNGGGIKE